MIYVRPPKGEVAKTKAKAESGFAERRLLSIKECAAYLGVCTELARRFAGDAEAVRHIGSRCLIDKVVIDRTLDAMG